MSLFFRVWCRADASVRRWPLVGQDTLNPRSDSFFAKLFCWKVRTVSRVYSLHDRVFGIRLDFSRWVTKKVERTCMSQVSPSAPHVLVNDRGKKSTGLGRSA